ncbi:MAG: KEOPS complex subunit Cgi121 [Nitrososphaerota archaeon]
MSPLDKNVIFLTYTASKAPEKDLSVFRSQFPSLFIQSLDPNCVASEEHVRLVLSQTVYASKIGRLLARKAEIDFLMRLAITDQIKEAIRVAGAKPGQRAIVVLCGRESQRAKEAMLASGFSDFVAWERKKVDHLLLVGKAALLGLKRRRVGLKELN